MKLNQSFFALKIYYKRIAIYRFAFHFHKINHVIMKGKNMKHLVFILSLLAFYPFHLKAQEMPPVCYGSYAYVKNIGSWSLTGNMWSLPFICNTGFIATVQIAVPDVPEIGYAEYMVQSEGIENDNIFFFTDPCLAMSRFCRYVEFGTNTDQGQIYSLE